MAATSKPVRKEINIEESKNKKRIKKLEEKGEIAPKGFRKLEEKKEDKKKNKEATKHMTEAMMKNRKERASMKF